MSATEVDHILPIEDGGAMYDEANLQALCKPHHSRKTARDKANRQRSPVLTQGGAGRKSREPLAGTKRSATFTIPRFSLRAPKMGS